jgi:hypothetical protein
MKSISGGLKERLKKNVVIICWIALLLVIGGCSSNSNSEATASDVNTQRFTLTGVDYKIGGVTYYEIVDNQTGALYLGHGSNNTYCQTLCPELGADGKPLSIQRAIREAGGQNGL